MSKADWTEILSLGDGIYRVKYHRLTVQALKNYRSRLTSDVFEIRRKVLEQQEYIATLLASLKEKEAMLSSLTEEKIEQFIELERQRKQRVKERANAFLERYIGPENYAVLQEKGAFEFVGGDGVQYRITRYGSLQRAYGNYWYNMCVMKPNDKLPLPDIIASVFTAAAKAPDTLKNSRLTKTREEVKR